MKLHEALFDRRAKAGISQAKLAGLIGSKSKTVMNIENGRTVPNAQTIWKLGAALCLGLHEVEKWIDLAGLHKQNRAELEREYSIKRATNCMPNLRR